MTSEDFTITGLAELAAMALPEDGKWYELTIRCRRVSGEAVQVDVGKTWRKMRYVDRPPLSEEEKAGNIRHESRR